MTLTGGKPQSPPFIVTFYLHINNSYLSIYDVKYMLHFQPEHHSLNSRPDKGKRFLFSSKRPHLFYIPPSLPFSGYRGFFLPGGKSGRGVMLTIYVHLMLKLRMNEAVRLLLYVFME
jgi:hypothetical protein